MEAGSGKRSPGMHTRMRDRQVKNADLPVLPGSRFAAQNIPYVLWPDLLDEFGTDYIYHTAEGEEFQARGILIEGMETEAVSPGRYARFWVDTRDLPREPRSADWLILPGPVNYDVERVDATLYDLDRLVIKLASGDWEPPR